MHVCFPKPLTDIHELNEGLPSVEYKLEAQCESQPVLQGAHWLCSVQFWTTLCFGLFRRLWANAPLYFHILLSALTIIERLPRDVLTLVLSCFLGQVWFAARWIWLEADRPVADILRRVDKHGHSCLMRTVRREHWKWNRTEQLSWFVENTGNEMKWTDIGTVPLLLFLL